MAAFHETGFGRRFFESQLPELITQLSRIATAIERLAAAREPRKHECDESCKFVCDDCGDHSDCNECGSCGGLARPMSDPQAKKGARR